MRISFDHQIYFSTYLRQRAVVLIASVVLGYVCQLTVARADPATATATRLAASDTPAPAVSLTELEDARYAEAKLRALFARCQIPDACSQDLSAAISKRLEVVAHERERFNAAQSESDYRAYLSQCVACTFREQAEQLMRASAIPATPPPTPSSESPAVAAPPASAAPPPPPPPPPSMWNAVAHLIYKRGGRLRVSVGYSGLRSSPEEAVRAARQSCERSTNGRECDASQASNSGCFYITIGNSRRGVSWGSGSSEDEAIRKCKQGQYSCDTPIGGCVN